MRNLISSTNTTINGTTATKLGGIATSTTSKRQGLFIKNHDASPIWIDIVTRGASTPTISSSSNILEIAAYQTAYIAASESVEVYGLNQTGAATTSNVSIREVGY